MDEKEKYLKSVELLDQMASDEVITDTLAVTTEAGDYPIYGYLIAYTFGEMWIPHNDAQTIWDARGIRVRPSTHIDALRKAISKFREVTVGNTIYRIRFRGYTKNERALIYRWEVSKHTADDPECTQDHQSIAVIEARKVGKEILMEDITLRYLQETSDADTTHAIQNDIYQPVTSLYGRLITHINNDMIRDTVISHIKSHYGIRFVVGRGGAWFVPASEREFIQALKQCIKDSKAYARNNVDIRIVPVVRDKDLRDAVAEDVARHVKQEYHRLLKQTLRRLENVEDEDIAEDILGDAIEEKEKITSLMGKYESLLKTTIEVTLDEDDETETTNPMLMSGRLGALLSNLRKVDTNE